ncbi:MAG: hypothetical protein QM783_01960 [Phycisphaerales bacterium]
MRINRFITALSAATAALFISTTTGAASVAAPSDPEPASLSWLADLIDTAADGGNENVQIQAVTTINGQPVELPEGFKRQILSFVSDALRSGTVSDHGSVSVIALDESGNVIYSSDELPESLDELIDLVKGL